MQALQTQAAPHAQPAAREVRSTPAQRRWIEAALVCALAAGAGTAVWYGSRGLDEALALRLPTDIWFEADCPRVFDNLTFNRSVHVRSGVHPLFALWLQPIAAAAQWGLGLSPLLAARAVRALTAAACVAAFYTLLRGLGCRRLDSAALCVLAGVSAGAMFWFVVPETYPPGLLTILLALNLVMLGQRRRVPLVWDVLANVATLSFTVTNWMVGLLGAFVRWPWRRALLIAGVAVCLLQFLLAVQHQVFPSAALWPNPLDETQYVLHPDAGGPGRVLAAFMCHSMVMPEVETSARYAWRVGLVLTVQGSWPGSSGWWAVAALIAWGLLLVLGAYGLATCGGRWRLRAVLALTVVGQLLLHVLYGPETFTYACHFGPLLVLVAGLATLTRARRIALGLVAALIVCAAINNYGQFRRARQFVTDRAAGRAECRMRAAGCTMQNAEGGLQNAEGGVQMTPGGVSWRIWRGVGAR